jgi:hypothetical protein
MPVRECAFDYQEPRGDPAIVTPISSAPFDANIRRTEAVV